MSASVPDSHPDSAPSVPSDDVERVSPDSDSGRESVEDTPDGSVATSSYATHDGSPLDPPGIEDGVAGTGGVNKAQDGPTS